VSNLGKSLAAVATKPLHTELREFPVPEVGADSGRLRVVATGICGSDWPMYNSEKPGPRILGHEMIGEIDQIGDIARERWGVKEGDLVALEEYLPCGHCDFCRTGEYRSCMETDTRLPGSIRYGSTPLTVKPSLWGGFSQYLYMHPRTVLHRVPAGIPAHIAAMALPIGNGFQWTYLDGGAGPGKTVVIEGPGQQGLGCVIAAKAAGADTIILTGLARDEHRLAVGRELGANHTITVDQENLVDAVRKITNGRMADLVIETSGADSRIINDSIPLVRKRGTLLLASRKGERVADFDADMIMYMQINLRGMRGHSFEAVELALKTMASGRLPLAKMSTHVIGLHDLDEALRMVGGQSKERSIHITVEPWKQ
jgi:threonine dehydrogenase-like Zn-dependent dehydrogenase